MPKTTKKTPTKKMQTTNTASKKATKKPAAIAGMFFFGLAAAIIVFVMVAKLVVVDECGSPCKGTDVACPAVCVKVTLWDKISDSMRDFLTVSDKEDSLHIAGKSYTVKSAGQYGDIEINVNDSNVITVGYNMDIQCIQAPCPQPRTKTNVDFSEKNMDIVRDFIHRLPSESRYDDLSYQDKRVLMSMVLDEEQDIARYEFVYYVDTIRYHIVESFGEISIEYEDRMNNTSYDMTPDNEVDIELARRLIHDYCDRKNNYVVYMQSYDFIPEETRTIIEHLLHLDELTK